MDCPRCNLQHERCAAHRRDGRPCRSHPVDGADKCRLHLGKKLEQHRQKVAAIKAVQTYGLPAEVDPHDALLEEVHRTAGHVRWLGQIVGELDQGDLVWGVAQEKTGGDDWGTTSKAAPNVWLELYHRERQHLVKVAKAAIDAGIDERRVQLAEEQGRVIVDVLRATLTDLGVDVTPDVAATVGRHLRAVS
jgi:hypothetical protein